MSLIQIDENKCQKDGLCVAECPAFIIGQQSKESLPEMVAGGDAMCLECGHCVAVCPHGALNHQKVPLEDSPPMKKENSISQPQAVQFLRSRRSIRHFKSKTPDKEVIQELIETARYAPTGGNVQTVSWTVFTDREDVKKIAELTVDWMRSALENPAQKQMASYFPLMVAAWDGGLDVILRNAPVLVVASVPGETLNGMADISISLSYLELAAVSMGLGTCWAGLGQYALLESKPLQEFIGLPDSHQNHYPMMLGYPKYRFHRLPERKAPRIFWR